MTWLTRPTWWVRESAEDTQTPGLTRAALPGIAGGRVACPGSAGRNAVPATGSARPDYAGDQHHDPVHLRHQFRYVLGLLRDHVVWTGIVLRRLRLRCRARRA